MAHLFHLYFETPQATERAAERLARVRYQERQTHAAVGKGCGVFVGCRIYESLPRDAGLNLLGTSRETPLFELFYQAEGVKSGMHHLDGMLPLNEWTCAPGLGATV